VLHASRISGLVAEWMFEMLITYSSLDLLKTGVVEFQFLVGTIDKQALKLLDCHTSSVADLSHACTGADNWSVNKPFRVSCPCSRRMVTVFSAMALNVTGAACLRF